MADIKNTNPGGTAPGPRLSPILHLANQIARGLANLELTATGLALPLVAGTLPADAADPSADPQAESWYSQQLMSEFEPLTPDFSLLVRYGIGVLLDAFATWSEFDPENEYYRAAQISLTAFQAMIARLATELSTKLATDLTEQQAAQSVRPADERTAQPLAEPSSQFAAELTAQQAAETAAANRQHQRQTLDNLLAIRNEPPRTFPQALQLFWLACLMRRLETRDTVIKIGHFDQYMLPFYRRDILNNELNRSQARAWLEAVWLQMNEQACASVEAPLAGFQIMIGGEHGDGSDETNELSFHCLEIALQHHLTQLEFLILLHPSLPAPFARRVQIMQRDERARIRLVSSF